jgi:hypothetical protein
MYTRSGSPAGQKNGKLRLCVDYLKRNSITIKNHYPLQNISELRDQLSNAKIFTKFDLRGAYNLVCMAGGKEYKTVFRIEHRHN